MIEIDVKAIESQEDFYKILNEKLDFDYYVENLDALFDQLIYSYPRLRIVNYKYLYKNLGDYGKRLMEVFLDSVRMYDIDIDFIS